MATVLVEEKQKEETAMSDNLEKCKYCRFFNDDGYCQVKDKRVNPDSSCPEFEER